LVVELVGVVSLEWTVAPDSMFADRNQTSPQKVSSQEEFVVLSMVLLEKQHAYVRFFYLIAYLKSHNLQKHLAIGWCS
jgi:hypothetical protein